MSTTSDVVEPVLDDIIENIQLEVEDIEDTTTANIQLEAKDIEDTTTTTTDIIMSKPSTSKKDKEEALIKKLQEEKKEIQDQIEEIEENKDVNTEKTIHLRNLRAKKRDIIKELDASRASDISVKVLKQCSQLISKRSADYFNEDVHHIHICISEES